LTDDAKFERDGVPGLLSPEGFDIAYNNYQAHVLDKLNQVTAGTNAAPPPNPSGAVDGHCWLA
jgi:superoxide dismutase